MAPNKPSVSSGSEKGPINATSDAKTMKRKESNRLSAQRSRDRKQLQLEELQRQVVLLKEENQLYSDRINATSQLHQNMASQNDVLRAQYEELSDRLRSMNDVIHVASEVNGMVFDTQEIPDTSLKPWQLPFPVQPMLPEPLLTLPMLQQPPCLPLQMLQQQPPPCLPQQLLQDPSLPQQHMLQEPWQLLSHLAQPIAAAADNFFC